MMAKEDIKAILGIKKAIVLVVAVILLLGAGLFFFYRYGLSDKEITVSDNMDNNVFPSLILSTATTDANIIAFEDSLWVGYQKSPFYIKYKVDHPVGKVKVTIKETKYSYESISEHNIDGLGKVVNIYPAINWKFEELKSNSQPTPISFSIMVENDKGNKYETIYTMSMRSVNECITAYVDSKGKQHDTSILFAAYINEDSPLIDNLLREALDSKIVNYFEGYQSKRTSYVDKQVYAIWHVLVSRNFKYSSISNSSFYSKKIAVQKVRTFEESMRSAQINCVDGSVMFASMLKAINIDPVLIKTPSHMFVGYYLDKKHEKMSFIETSMVGIEFSEMTDSLATPNMRKDLSKKSFDKSKDYAERAYKDVKAKLDSCIYGYDFIDISTIRNRIQPIGL